MFAYCNNAPVSSADPSGYCLNPTRAFTACDDPGGFGGFCCGDSSFSVKALLKTTAKTLSNVTVVGGLSGRAACGVSVNGSVYVAADIKGNFALYVSYGSGGGFPSASASVYGGFISSPDARYLGGLGFATGGSIGEVLGVGGDYIIAIDDEHNTTYHGATVGVKTIIEVPVPVEMHCDVSNSNMIYSFNIFDFASSVWEAIKSVF